MEGINMLPFHFLDDNEFCLFIKDIDSNNIVDMNNVNISQLNNTLFNQFGNTEAHNLQNCPDNNYYNNYCCLINECQYILPEEINNVTKNNLFSCCTYNINSIPKHFGEFEFECLNNSNFDVIGFCETKLTNDIEHLFELNNYNRFNNNKSRNSGGVALYVKNKFDNLILLNEFTRKSASIESLFIQFEINNIKIVCGVVYHRPDTSYNDFINEMNLIMNEVTKKL